MGYGTNKKVILLLPLQRLFERRVRTGVTGKNGYSGRTEGPEKIDALDILDDLEADR